MKEIQNRNSKAPINYWSIFKLVGILAVISFGIIFNFPAVSLLKEWVHEDYYYHHNWVNWTYPENRSVTSIQMWDHMSQRQQITFYLVLVPYILFVLCWLILITRYRFKKIYINGLSEGRAIWYYGIYKNGKPYPGGHLYDLYYIAHGFRHRSWDDYNLPIAGDFYKGKKVIYYNPYLFMNPLHCMHVVVKDDSQVSFGLFTVAITGKFGYNVKHSSNVYLDYMEWNNIAPDRSQESNIEEYNRYTDEVTLRSQKITTQAILGNPAVIEDVVRSSDTSIPMQTKVDFFELLPADKKVEMIARLKKG